MSKNTSLLSWLVAGASLRHPRELTAGIDDRTQDAIKSLTSRYRASRGNHSLLTHPPLVRYKKRKPARGLSRPSGHHKAESEKKHRDSTLRTRVSIRPCRHPGRQVRYNSAVRQTQVANDSTMEVLVDSPRSDSKNWSSTNTHSPGGAILVQKANFGPQARWRSRYRTATIQYCCGMHRCVSGPHRTDCQLGPHKQSARDRRARPGSAVD